ncbi:hypothetical protein QQG74_09060 [Micromonospora sp. FIMYZ51]|uniref:hypothetical protein n=1 Tax=Micromonospora sp. FIMYZ51 TaxID=3051832 RepID=UPI00311E18E8
MTDFHCIEVAAFFGDEDTYHDLHLIGPYGSAARRDRDLVRLSELPGNNGDATFAASSRNPATADHWCTPDQIEHVKHFNQVVGVLYHYEVDDDGNDVRYHAAEVPTPAAPGRRTARQVTGQDALFDLAGGAA